MLEDLPETEQMELCLQWAVRELKLGRRLPLKLRTAILEYGKAIRDFNARHYALQMIPELENRYSGKELFAEVARRLDFFDANGEPRARAIQQFWEERNKAVRRPDGKQIRLGYYVDDERVTRKPGRPKKRIPKKSP